KKDNSFEKIGLKTKFISSWFMPFGHLGMLNDMKNADKIIVHCLASPYLLMFLFLFKNLNKKVYWIVWGKDLYIYHTSERRGIFLKFYEYFRKNVIKNIGYIVTAFEEEYDLAKKWYNVNGKSIIINMLYPNSVDFHEHESKYVKNNSGIVVLLGNSGSKTNRHIDALNKIYEIKDKIYRIYIPLSYGGPKKYAYKVKNIANNLFGKKCSVLMEFIPFNGYSEILDSVDVAFFYHNRQEAVGNVYSMIMKEKTVYLNNYVTTYKFLNRIGVVIKDSKNISSEKDLVLSQDIKKNNKNILYEYIKPEVSIDGWKKILE
ncbi:TDP-N-acetylfucosamine:lipid II N-acetylfucosaminyltransferase, partial [Thomasclavelia spiroformis]|uniref:TDP-N-acetylfucosamine:lipid II N-acetylfucosaminyltransferase n=1 Tax=Thomasclavelia spiroformis TaxID=29348 RepID=UPI0024B26A55